ncbi:MAG TPA: hypothetical protein VGC76_03015 [Pyrinomonadaceae bacterium]|jgi:hypothetical protein
MKLKIFILFASLCCFSTAFGQNVEKTLQKSYQKWSQEEALKIISSKPFADQYQSSSGMNAIAQQQQAREQADTFLGGNQRGRTIDGVRTVTPIVIRLHSALPVRQAQVRLRQIQAGYDKMNGEERKKFDESQKIMLECAICKDYYVVTITKFTDSSGTSVDNGIFQLMKFEDFKGKIWLVNDKDEKRELAQFTPPKKAGEPAVFYFKRTDEKGNLLLTTDSKTLKFVFSNDLLDDDNQYSYLLPRTFEFSVSKLIFNNKVEF